MATGRNEALVRKSPGRKQLSSLCFPLAALTAQPTGWCSPRAEQVLFSRLILSRSMLTDAPDVCLTDVPDPGIGYQLWVSLGPPKYEILTLVNNRPKGAQ